MNHAPVTTKIDAEFPLDENLIYLNHAAVGPWPLRTVQAIEHFARENMHRAISNYRLWIDAEERLRGRLSDLIGASDNNQIALLKNTSEAVSTVAFGLDWRDGDNIVLPAEEFPANQAPWTALEMRGVEVRLVPTRDFANPERRLLEHCDSGTRLLSTSSVHFSSGRRMMLEQLGEACRERNILFFVDAIQSLGVIPLDVQALHIDFLASGSHKWLLAPEGVGFLYCRGDLLERVQPLSRGWRMGEKPFDFERENWGPARSARRFECGTLNTLGVIALDASLSLFEEIGLDRVSARVMERSAYLIERLSGIDGIEVATPLNRRAGIVSLSSDKTIDLYRRLRKANVMPAMRDGLLRLAPHFHTPMSQLETVCELLSTRENDD